MESIRTPEVPAVTKLVNKDNTKPVPRKTINKIIAFLFFTFPEDNGLLGRSTLSVLISNKSFETSPPKYNKIEEIIRMIRYTMWLSEGTMLAL